MNGENSLVVLADNSRRSDGIPADLQDWWNYGGITRSVKLIEVPETFIREYALYVDDGLIRGSLTLDGDSAGKKVNVSIPALGAEVETVTGTNGIAEFEIDASPELWYPENPVLYDVVLTSSMDEVHDRIGSRYIETDGDRLILNGKDIFCRGVCLHGETHFSSRRITSVEEARVLLQWAKEKDSTRLVSAALLTHERLPDGRFTITDPLIEKSDIISFNLYMGWYWNMKDYVTEMNWTFSEKKPGSWLISVRPPSPYGNSG